MARRKSGSGCRAGCLRSAQYPLVPSFRVGGKGPDRQLWGPDLPDVCQGVHVGQSGQVMQ